MTFEQWFDALEERHLKELSFQEVRRSVQALSTLYVERRDNVRMAKLFAGRGLRAAFAYFYSPLHFLLVREVVRALDAGTGKQIALQDLGCGTGSAGAAWALEMTHPPKLIGIDRNSWAVQETRWTYSTLGLSGSAKVGDVTRLRVPSGTAVVAAYTVNELPDPDRESLRSEFLAVHKRGAPVLIIEPISRRVTPWWDEWADSIKSAGGREDEWRFRVALPERLALMDKAAGLDHRELTCRSLFLHGKLP